MNEFCFETKITGPVSTNTYVFGNRNDAIMLDPGGPEAIDFAIKMHSEGITINHIIISHGHFDHMSWASEVANSSGGAKVYLSAAERPYYREYHDWLNKYGIKSPKLEIPDIWFNDGEILQISGIEIKAIHTPGHTPGSFIFMVDNNLSQDISKTLVFTGDLLFKNSIGRVDLPYSNPNEMVNSLRKIIDILPSSAILPGHGEFTKFDLELVNNPYLLAIQRNIPIF